MSDSNRRKNAASRSPTPITGFDSDGNPVPELHTGSEILSPIERNRPRTRSQSKSTDGDSERSSIYAGEWDYNDYTESSEHTHFNVLVNQCMNGTVILSDDDDEFLDPEEGDLDNTVQEVGNMSDDETASTGTPPGAEEREAAARAAAQTAAKAGAAAGAAAAAAAAAAAERCNTPRPQVNVEPPNIPAANAIPQGMEEHVRHVVRAEVMWADFYSKLVMEEMPRTRLEKVMDKAEELKDDMIESGMEIQLSHPEFFDLDARATFSQTKTGFIDLIRAGYAALRAHEVAAQQQQTAADTSKQVKADRVKKYEAATILELKTLKEELEQLDKVQPADEPSYVMHYEKVCEVRAKAQGLAADAKSLIDDATDAGLTLAASAVDDAYRDLKSAEKSSGSTLLDKKAAFGVLSTTIRQSKSDVPPPTYAGETNPDFFTFKDEWDQYVGSKSMSEQEKFRVLTRTCLTGQAKNVVKRFKTVPEVFEHLKKTFGNPRYLFGAKIEEMRKLGPCSGSDSKKREWVVDVRARLEDVHKLASDHEGLLEKLYHEGVVGEIQSMLPYNIVRQFKKAVRKKDKTGGLSGKGLWDALCLFLDELTDELTFEINHSLNTRSEKSKEEKKGNVNPKRSYATNVYEDSDGDCENERDPVSAAHAQPTPVRPPKKSSKPVKNKQNLIVSVNVAAPRETSCFHCPNETHTYAYMCPVFQTVKGRDRIAVAAKMRSCFRCLRLDAKHDSKYDKNWFDQHKVNCSDKWVCRLGKCADMTESAQWHIFMCCFHQTENKSCESEFIKKELDPKTIPNDLSFFFNDPLVAMATVSAAAPSNDVRILDDISAPSIFMLQIIVRKGKELLCFYDTGCGGATLNGRAAEILDSVEVREGPSSLHVAGGKSIKIDGGDESFQLSLHDSDLKATITGLRLEAVTTRFPVWHISKAWKDITSELSTAFPGHAPLPAAPDMIGGAPVDLMLGIRYIRYFPQLMFMLPSGLGVYKSQLAAKNDEVCILGGPHPSWERCKESSNFAGAHSFFTAELRAYYFSCSTLKYVDSPIQHLPVEGDKGLDLVGYVDAESQGEDLNNSFLSSTNDTGHTPVYSIDYDPDYKTLAIDEDFLDDAAEHAELCNIAHCSEHSDDTEWVIPPSWDTINTVHGIRETTTRYLESELSGSEIQYRCVKCRNCSSCRNSGTLESASLREEAEQYLIEQCVEFHPERKKLVGKLPFIHPPKENLMPNRYCAERVFEHQMRQITKSENMRSDVIASFNKLAEKGYVMPIDSLPDELRDKVLEPIDAGHYIPWRVVYKEGSLSTPCRIVFDASARTPGGMSLNECLAKGENRLISINHILLKFRNKPAAFSTDIRQAYNQIELHEDHIRYQRFLWRKDLDPANPIEEHVVGTLIYGVKPAGNEMSAGHVRVADYCIEWYPEHTAGAVALKEKTYVDDNLTADEDKTTSKATAASLDFTLGLAGMTVKSYTHSGEAPSPDVSADGVHVGVVGLLWAPEEDNLSLDVKPLYFGKTRRGKRPELIEGNFLPALKKNFSRRNMLGKCAGIFDPLGLATPVTSRFKLNLHSLIDLRLGWDDPIPDSELEAWVRNLNDMQELREINFRRTIIPEDAASLDVNLLISSDASMNIAIATVHARVPLKQGGYSCQLVTAKSKLIKELTIPKAELRAAVLATHLAHTVKYNLADQFKSSMYCTDSSILLFWIHQDERPLETVVRNGVIEIRRFTNPSLWFHIPTHLNIADLGTRYASVSDIGRGSSWQEGMEWMRLNKGDMPIKSANEVKISNEEKRAAAEELKPASIAGIALSALADRVSDRYAYGEYLYDPNKYGWLRASRVMGFVLKFVTICRPNFKYEWIPHKNETLSNVVFRSEANFKKADGTSSSALVLLTGWNIKVAQNYFFNIGYKEVLKFVPKQQLKHTDVRNGIMYYTGRVLQGQTILDPLNVMTDLQPLSFVQPVLDRYSPVAYSIMIYCHTSVSHHKSAIATLRDSREFAYILRGRDLAIEIRENCRPCKRFSARLLKIEMGKMHSTRLTIAPAFFMSQVDLFGPMIARCEHNHRSNLKLYGVVFKCPVTCAIAVFVMQNYSTDSFLSAYTRFSSRYGHPNKLFIDQGSQLMSACNRMELSTIDLCNNLSTKYGVGVEFETCAVGGHNAHGMVERSIRTVKNMFEKVYRGLKLDLFAYETAFSWISSQLNNMPICIGSRSDNLGSVDLITPSRLILGRGSTRAAGGYARISPPTRMVKQMDEVFDSWWNVWLTEKIADYVPQPDKWPDGNVNVQIGDIVLMRLDDAEKKIGGPVYKMSRISQLFYGTDGIPREAMFEYRNRENTLKTTKRSLRTVTVVHSEGDLDVIQQLNRSAKEAGIAFHAARAFEPP